MSERVTQSGQANGDKPEHPPLSYGHLLAVLMALLALTGLTVAAARVDFGGLNIWLTLLIAATKATLVLSFFMHLKFESRAFHVTFLVTLFVVAAFIGFLFWDISFRQPPPP